MLLLRAVDVCRLCVSPTGWLGSVVWSWWVALLSAESLNLLFHAVLSLFEVSVLGLECGYRVVEGGKEALKLFYFHSQYFNSAEYCIVGGKGGLCCHFAFQDGWSLTKGEAGRA